MNVFVLCTGRSGSKSFIKACNQITNFSSGHESKSHLLGEERFAFSKNHIEADNRFSWQLGLLDKYYGKESLYIHLKRDPEEVAQSFQSRFLLPKSMIYAYANGIKKQPPETLNKTQRLEICRDYVNTVDTNIELFLKDKPHQIDIELSEIKEGFKTFWETIKAEGDLDLALKEFDIRHNKKPSKTFNLNYNLKHSYLKIKMHFNQMFSDR